MVDNRPKKPHDTKTGSQKTGKRVDKRFPDQTASPLTQMIRTFGNKIPLDLPSPGIRIVAFFGIVLIALFALLLIGVIVANVTGSYDKIWTIFAGEIIIVGILTLAAAMLTFRKTVK
jgi:hypothetical protein